LNPHRISPTWPSTMRVYQIPPPGLFLIYREPTY
jgi:hypothetical protein